MTSAQTLLTIVTLLVQFGTACTLIYTFGGFLKKPHNVLDTRISIVEKRLKELEQDEYRIDVRCKEQDETNEVLIHSVMALIEFEIQYCLTEKKEISKDLENARLTLHNYLAKK